MTKVPGAMSSRSEPTALTETISVTPARFMASMLARKLSSEGGTRWPRPWRGRKTMAWPSSSPKSISSEGFPKELSTARHSRPVSPSMS